MKKIVVIYWSGTGNTQAMAEAVAEGAKSNDVKVDLLNVSQAKIDDVEKADAVALGCPSMGAEVLEEYEMEPFVESLSGKISGKPIVLFGSYGWGDGEWMADWEERIKQQDANLLKEGLIINEMPDDEGINNCKELGLMLAKEIA
ncbi:flavodoxin [Alkalibacter saccharofermentans]|uniref:Flavodoxin n=1 Tax=Alkalibacter saccharofermentans DSM 14828 TaxID=1120975 RepID=A0A1M4ZU65_9FIRM|nr:flavodoxin [Alkalibacter saccharofermentans]SHF21322.1 flavodoxin, short chain [Alkalibacter saccharofermentans DSM 14828]